MLDREKIKAEFRAYLNEAKIEKVIVKSLGRAPRYSPFDKEYIIIFISRKTEGVYYPAWTVSLGYESNVDLKDEDLVDVTKAEALKFIEYYNEETKSRVILK